MSWKICPLSHHHSTGYSTLFSFGKIAKDRTPIEWTKDVQEAFEKYKIGLANSTMLE